MRPLLRIFRFCNPQRKHLDHALAFEPGAGDKRGFGSYYGCMVYISLVTAFRNDPCLFREGDSGWGLTEIRDFKQSPDFWNGPAVGRPVKRIAVSFPGIIL